MTPLQEIIIMFVALVVLLFLGFPLAISLGSLGIIFGLLWIGPNCLSMFAYRCYGIMVNMVLIAVPLFILMASFLERSGIAEVALDGMRAITGPLRGGLVVAVVLTCTLMGAGTGIIATGIVTMGLVAAPSMLRYGYQKELTTGVICASGTLGILIPPSIMLVFMGAQTGQSVGKLFMAGVGPGLLLSGLYISYALIRCGFRPDLGPPVPIEERRLVPIRSRLLLFTKGALPMIVLIFAVVGSIFLGIATPSEASAIGAFAALLMMAAYGKFTFSAINSAVTETLKVTSMVMLIFVGASCFTGTFMRIGGGRVISTMLLALPSEWVVLVVMMTIIFLLGMFIDWLGILLLVIPIFMPIVIELGFDPLWFILVVAVNLQMAFLTPPFGYALFFMKGTAPPEVTMMHIYRGIVPFVALQILGLVLVILFPSIITWLPGIMFGK